LLFHIFPNAAVVNFAYFAETSNSMSNDMYMVHNNIVVIINVQLKSKVKSVSKIIVAQNITS
jgi:hypothetical protein